MDLAIPKRESLFFDEEVIVDPNQEIQSKINELKQIQTRINLNQQTVTDQSRIFAVFDYIIDQKKSLGKYIQFESLEKRFTNTIDMYRLTHIEQDIAKRRQLDRLQQILDVELTTNQKEFLVQANLVQLLVELDKKSIDYAIKYAMVRYKKAYKIRLTTEQLLQMIMIVQQLQTTETAVLQKVDATVLNLKKQMNTNMNLKIKRYGNVQKKESITTVVKKTLWGLAGGLTAGWALTQLVKLGLVVLPMIIKAVVK